MIRVAETLSRDRAEFLGTCQRNLPFSKSVEAWKVQSVLCDGTARIPVLRGARNRQEIDRPLFRDATHRLFPPLRSFYRGPPVPGREKEEKKEEKRERKGRRKYPLRLTEDTIEDSRRILRENDRLTVPFEKTDSILSIHLAST